MNDSTIAILGGLVGSGITIFVTKFFEIVQSHQQHRLTLKKELFVRKLTVFEKSVSYWTIAHTSITNMAVLVKIALNEDVFFTQEQSKNIFDRLEQNVQEVYKATQETAGSIDLYIDLGHDDKEVEITQRFWELLGLINQTVHIVNQGYDLLSLANSPDDVNRLNDAIAMETKRLSKEVEELLIISQNLRKRYLAFASLLRNKVKEFE